MAATAADNRSWYVLQVAPNRERVARSFLSPTDADLAKADSMIQRHGDALKNHLIARRFEPYVPMERVKRTRGVIRRKVVFERPMFPGYAFIRLDFQEDRERLHLIRLAPGVVGFVRLGEDYAIISDPDMAKIGRLEADAMVPRAKPKVFHVSEEVRISDGPFSGFNGNIFELTDSERIGLLVNLFGRKTPVRLDEDQLEKL
jgi:transcription termination/antitermination protein NusG